MARTTLATLLRQAASDLRSSAVTETPASAKTDEPPMWSPLLPQPGRGIKYDGRLLSPQQLALETPADELLFGGAPGGGKSHLVIGAAATQHRNSIIFRRELKQHKGEEGLWDVSHQVIGIRGTPNEANLSWRDLPGGRSIIFAATGHLQSHWAKWQGKPHDLKAYDELPEIPEAAYRFLNGWLRTKHVGQRVRSIATANPPTTPEGRWVIRHWAPWLDDQHPDPAKPGELRWFVVDTDGRDREVPGPRTGWTRPAPVLIGGDAKCKHALDQLQRCARCKGRFVQPRSRTFVPSSVEDNPIYMATGYTTVLDNLPEPLRSLMRDGNFKASTPDHPMQIIPTAWVDAAIARWKPDMHRTHKLALTMAGNDASRGGEDEFVIAKRYEWWVGPLAVHQAKEAKDGIAGAQLVFNAVGDLKVPVQIDIGGQAGPAVYDQYRQLGGEAVALNGAEGSDETTNTGKPGDPRGKLKFFNKRAKWYWRMRELLDPANKMDIALPPDPQMRSDLCATRWELTVRGIKAEPKEDVIARLGRSPDRGEGVIYACVEETEGAPKPRMSGAVW